VRLKEIGKYFVFNRPLGLSMFNILTYGALQSLPEENVDEHEVHLLCANFGYGTFLCRVKR